MPAAPELVKPLHLWVPDHVSTAAEEAIDLAEQVGIPPYPEQRVALEVILAERADGRWAAFEAAVVGARQNIKTYLFKVVALADLYLFSTRLTVWTAHEFSTTMEAFRDVRELIDGHDFLSRRVKKITTQNGEEGIELTNGQRLRFKARTLTGGRGLTGDRVILDEAFALRPSHMGSLMPTMSAKSMRGNPQIIYGSSGGFATSAVLRGIRDRGRAGGDPSLAYVEYGAETGDCATPGCDHRYGTEGCLLDDEDRWRQANILLGRLISIDFLRTERRSLDPAEFAREVMVWWEDPRPEDAAWEVIDETKWAACKVEQWDPAGLGWTIDVSPDSRSAAIACSNGVTAEVVDYRDGTDWLVPRLLELQQRHGFDEIALDANGPAGSLINALDTAGIEYRKVKISEHAQACLGLLAAIDAGTFHHIGQEPLDAAAAVAVRRTVTDVWLWTRAKSSGDICPLVAVTLARWFALTLREDGDADFFTL